MLASWQHLYASVGHALDLERWLATVGGDVEDRYAALGSLVGEGYDAAAVHEQRRAYELGLVRDLPLREGWPELLEQAVARGVRLGIVSSSPLWWVGGHLERLGVLDLFDPVVTREDAERAKPHPDLYLVALARLGLPAAQVLVVEDSVNGALAARAAGLPVVVVPNPVTARQEHVVPAYDVPGLGRLLGCGAA